MNKYELTFEVRYNDVDNFRHNLETKSQITTLGIFDTYDDACRAGNDFLDNTISKYYKRPNYDNFCRIGALCINLSTNSRLDCGITYFVKIRKIRMGNPIDLIMDAKDAAERVKEYKKKYGED